MRLKIVQLKKHNCFGESNYSYVELQLIPCRCGGWKCKTCSFVQLTFLRNVASACV